MQISQSKKSENKICSDDPLRRMILSLFDTNKRKTKQTTSYPLFLFWYAMPILKTLPHASILQQSNYQRVQQLDHNRQIDAIIQVLSKTNVRFEKFIAQTSTMMQLIGKQPQFLHFSGHGQSEINKKKSAQKGQDSLLFEDQYGMTQKVGITKIRKLLESIGKPIKFIFVASCHSKCIGELFLKAGAHHVICVRRQQRILDQACQIFVKSFYRCCIIEKRTICQSYGFAVKQVSLMNFPPGQQFKFVMLKQKQQHQCQRLSQAGPGQLIDITYRPKYQFPPPKVEYFVGRYEEKQELVQAVLTNRFVTVRGVPGIGKSTLARQVSLFLLERKRFMDGIIYLNLQGVDTMHSLISSLVSKVDINESKMLQQDLLQKLKNCRILIIFDNCDALLSQEFQKDKLQKFIQELLHRCSRCKILFTSRSNIIIESRLELSGCYQKVIMLSKMTLPDSYQLFFKKSRKIQSAQVQQLYKQTDYQGRLQRHPLFSQLLNGHPQAVSLAASLLSSNSLKNLYKMLLSQPLSQLSQDTNLSFQQQKSYNSFCLSLQLTYRLISNKDKDAVRMFGLMGMMPAGVTIQFLQMVFPVKCKQKLGLLIRHSLVHRNTREDQTYQIHPFISSYAQSKLSQADRHNFHVRIVQYLLSKIQIIYRNVGTISCQSQKSGTQFEEDQQNIRAALVREFATISGSKKASGLQCLNRNWGLKNALKITQLQQQLINQQDIKQKQTKKKIASESQIKSNSSRSVSSQTTHSTNVRPISPILKLLIYSATILLLMRNIGDCSRMVRLGLLLARRTGCLMSKGNLTRLKGCLSLIQNQQQQALNYFQQALIDFSKAGCSLGRAISQAAIGFIFYSQKQMRVSKQKLQSSFTVYENLGHRYGQHYLNRWLYQAKSKLFGKGISKHDSEARNLQMQIRKNIKNNKINNIFIQKHKGGVFVFRGMMFDNLSIFLQCALLVDQQPKKHKKSKKIKLAEIKQRLACSDDSQFLSDVQDLPIGQYSQTSRQKSHSVYEKTQKKPKKAH